MTLQEQENNISPLLSLCMGLFHPHTQTHTHKCTHKGKACEDTARGWSSTSQKDTPLQKPALVAPDHGPPASRTGENECCLCHPVYNILLWQLLEIPTTPQSKRGCLTATMYTLIRTLTGWLGGIPCWILSCPLSSKLESSRLL